MQMWHETKKGKSLDDLKHIEDEARQRMAAEAAMQPGKRQAAKDRKAAAKAEPPVAQVEAPVATAEPPAVEAAPEPDATEPKGE
jgi:hypothetical protein